ncbi:hypothetical protein GX48_02244 [Paracoccidioides brasiliensis]|nr:hypothetical protein GX48_02244 [Paracoccidioides brasiliensis]
MLRRSPIPAFSARLLCLNHSNASYGLRQFLVKIFSRTVFDGVSPAGISSQESQPHTRTFRHKNYRGDYRATSNNGNGKRFGDTVLNAKVLAALISFLITPAELNFGGGLRILLRRDCNQRYMLLVELLNCATSPAKEDQGKGKYGRHESKAENWLVNNRQNSKKTKGEPGRYVSTGVLGLGFDDGDLAGQLLPHMFNNEKGA